MKFIAIIPARYSSTRFPGKPLAKLGGMTIINRVYNQVSTIFDKTVVATDDKRIEEEVLRFGGNVVMTKETHRSGTDRCYEAYTKQKEYFDVIVNVQGDEPFIQPSQLELLKACFKEEKTELSTLVKPFEKDASIQELENPNSPKVVINNNYEAMYFSRSIIPFIRGLKKENWLKQHTFYKHIGLYAYRSDILKKIASLPQTTLEKAESLEQLRWLENGFHIKVNITNEETIGIDTPQDLKDAESYLKKMNKK